MRVVKAQKNTIERTKGTRALSPAGARSGFLYGVLGSIALTFSACGGGHSGPAGTPAYVEPVREEPPDVQDEETSEADHAENHDPGLETPVLGGAPPRVTVALPGQAHVVVPAGE